MINFFTEWLTSLVKDKIPLSQIKYYLNEEKRTVAAQISTDFLTLEMKAKAHPTTAVLFAKF